MLLFRNLSFTRRPSLWLSIRDLVQLTDYTHGYEITHPSGDISTPKPASEVRLLLVNVLAYPNLPFI
ncbi:hypothetical protein Y032_0100g3290 [Ancylostoma ceylanicum]|uniref:Uncharacterized protein n=1 Tax=Ancylostoma ceylanicum TaxID=53326 RepID=A0A016TID6_9BILA|nr:hypothetical protein Y032_0100g3290 [Ancylostoma ceylanicum]